MRRLTITDVAREAGVSTTTVSRYLNGHFEKMGEETKERVAKTIKRLNYAPSASAQKLRQNESHLVGVLVGEISNPFSSLLSKGIYDVLQGAGYDILLMNADNSTATEARSLQRFVAQQVDGVIAQPSAIHFSQFQTLTDANIPLVLVDREVPDQPATVGRVTSANQDACYYLGPTLVERGYQNIITVSAHFAEASGQIPRIAGFQKASRTFGFNYSNIETKGHDKAWLRATLSHQLARLTGRTVIISLMGPVLFDLLAVFKELGLKFPKDVGLVSFDDWEWSRYVSDDGIFLLRQDMELMGNMAATALLKQLQTKTLTSPTTLLPVTTIDRPSL
ncbi:LacI family DNA-binding transcriptional regulator [Limosilactobacillus fermentum]|uniref:LacI family DNA-binding transcriptional regulator n=1 Tax=Limosilactobacillus fermentum TaxID=1613 RepID=UPI000E4C8170|nr:LacI family DNA-binding transcriptional regulator [Limosilactobacillus fermentum]MCH5384036.1 LacI family transcriptional regulator [Limosilactobacillus fermentum]RGU83490.1 LacI family DNA-binding transcriptional regulator [Limosilactobacillus fermentum]UOG12104.1 LacI family transcriptional regulator [Limosilactobacillus fermentum]